MHTISFDPASFPPEIQAELSALARDFDHLPPDRQWRAMQANFSAAADAYFAVRIVAFLRSQEDREILADARDRAEQGDGAV